LPDAALLSDDGVASRASAAVFVPVGAWALVTAVAVVTATGAAPPAADAATLSDVATPDGATAFALPTPPATAT